MIFNELPIVFPFYDKLEKQHRFRDVADGACMYKLITPRNALLPFQIKKEYNFNNDIFNRDEAFRDGYRLDPGGEIVEDEENVVTEYINVKSYEEIKIRSFQDFEISFFDDNKNFIGSATSSNSMGSWDSFELFTLSTSVAYIVVEVSKSKSTWQADKLYFSIIDESDEMGDIRVGDINEFNIISCCGAIVNTTTPDNLIKIYKESYEDGVRFIYRGQDLTIKTSTHPLGRGNEELNLGPGKYYVKILLTTGEEFYSEVFTIPKNAPNLNEIGDLYTKFTFWNTGDLSPIAYNTSFVWKQVFYTEAQCYTSNPVYEEEGERDINDQLKPTFKKLIINWVLTDLVPDYLKIALTSLQMHDNIIIKTGHREGRANRVSVEIGEENNFGMSSITINIEQDIISQRACDSNINKLPSNLLDFIN